MVWEDKSKYEGEWKDGMRHGKGTFYYTNGDKYVGDWKDDVQDGRVFIISRTASVTKATMPTENGQDVASTRIPTVTSTWESF